MRTRLQHFTEQPELFCYFTGSTKGRVVINDIYKNEQMEICHYVLDLPFNDPNRSSKKTSKIINKIYSAAIFHQSKVRVRL